MSTFWREFLSHRKYRIVFCPCSLEFVFTGMTSGGGGDEDIVPSSAKRALGLGVSGFDSC